MSVYVDRLRFAYVGAVPRAREWCHMIADSLEELHAMADAIGVKREWFQGNASFPHYDLTKTRRAAAVKLGAIEVDRRQLVTHIRRIREAA